MISIPEPLENQEPGGGRVERVFDAVVRLLVLAVLVVVPLIFIPWYRWDLFIPIKTFVMRTLVLVAACLCVLKVVITGRAGPVRSGLNLPVLLFLAAAALSLVNSPNTDVSLRALARLAFFVLTYFLIANYFHRGRHVNLLLSAVLVTFALVNIYAVLQQFGIDLIGPAEGRKCVDSTLGNPDYFAGYLVALIPLCLVCILIVNSKWRYAIAALAATGTAFLFLSQSRAGFGGFALSVLIMMGAVLFSKQTGMKVKAFCIALAGGAAGLLAVLTIVGETTLSRIEETLDLNSTSIRWRILCYRATLDIVADHPVTGTGIGTFYNVYPKYCVPEMSKVHPNITTPRQTHNDYLQIAAETGLAGLAAFAYLVFAFFRTGILNIKRSGQWRLRWLTVALLAGGAAILVQMIFDFNLHRPVNALYFWVILALMAALEQRPPDKRYLPLRPGRWTRLILIPLLAVAAVVMTKTAVAPFAGHVYYNRGSEFAAKGDLKRAVAAYHKATNWDKLDDIYYRTLGDAYTALTQTPDTARHAKKKYIKGAIESYKEAIAVGPYYAVNHFKLGRAYMLCGFGFETNFLKKAEQKLKKAIELSPNWEAEKFHNQLGLLYLRQGMHDEAIVEFNAALKVDPRHIPSYINLGNIHYSRENYDKSIEYYGKALEIDPDSAQILNNLGHSYSKKRMYAEAIESFDRALAVDRNYVDAYNGLGDIYLDLGKILLAKRMYMQVIHRSADTGHADYARRRLAEIESR